MEPILEQALQDVDDGNLSEHQRMRIWRLCQTLLDHAYRSLPASLMKWLSYRERAVRGRLATLRVTRFQRNVGASGGDFLKAGLQAGQADASQGDADEEQD